MQGKINRQPKLFSVVNLEEFVPKDHELRRFERVLDLNFIHEYTEKFYCKNNGRPSVDPELFMRMMLLSHIYGLSSDRALCQEIHCNLAYRWFCGINLEDEVPNHSSLTRIRDRLGEETFKFLFEKIIEQCQKNGLVSGKRLMADGTLINANASLYSMVKMGEEDKIENSDSHHRKTKWILGEKISNKTHTSATDPDSSLAGKMGNKMQLRYKDHRIIDADSRVILDTHITDGAQMEGKVFVDRLKKTEENLEIKADEIIADRGYGYGENLKTLIDEKRDIFIPTFHRDVGDGLQGFAFDKNNNHFICQNGKVLTPQKTMKTTTRYRTEKNACVNCPYQDQCKATQRKGYNNRIIVVSEYHLYQGMIRNKEKTDDFKSRMRERMWKVEGLFAEGKGNHGLKRAKYRGRAKMQIQAYIIACVQNLKRLAGRPLVTIFEFISNLLNYTEILFFIKNKKLCSYVGGRNYEMEF